MLTLDKFEEASEKVKEVVLPTNLVNIFQNRQEIKFILSLKICSIQERIR